MRPHRRPFATLLLVTALTACGGGGGSSSSGTTSGFEVLDINVAQGQIWKINRPLVLTFNKDVDFATVNLNTISLVELSGGTATGFFFQPDGDPRKVAFQPSCPTRADFADAGLLPSSEYRLLARGGTGGATVRSTDGDVLDVSKSRRFTTPDSSDPLELFVDTVAGPPQVLILPVRPEPGEAIDPSTPATHVEIGGVKRFFGRDPATQQGRLEDGLALPLNHYSLAENQVRFVVHFNQAVQPGAENAGRLELQWDDPGTGWRRLPADVVLTENCTESGATAEVRPRGILPQSSELRLVLKDGFADLTGDATSTVQSNFARSEAQAAGEANPLFGDVDGPEVDEVLETFEFGGGGLESLEDTGAVFPVPPAKWGDGRLQASFAFGGTGGPNGEFDWHIPPSTELVLDTSSDVIFGGPGGAQTGSQPVTNGIVDVRDVFLPTTSRIVIVGPNTCTILASGSVRILGEISVRGADNPGVGTLNTTNQPEVGSPGQAGGGNGGAGSPFTTQSSPRGAPGNGAFNQIGLGGQGGETSYVDGAAHTRRGAGGGGGTLGHETRYDHDGDPNTPLVRAQTLVGLDVEYGNAGTGTATGAESQSMRAQGGHAGPSPFLDNDPANDFLGTKLTTSGQMIRGELEGLIAGGGGGGGGDSSKTDVFPKQPFNPAGDEKGAGGGGGAGGLRILAIGPITIGSATQPGSINLDGGNGGPGENTGGFNRIGGGSGGGAGGHLVLSSAAEVTIHGRAETGEPWFGDSVSSKHSGRAVSAVGGQGGAGNSDKGGTKSTGPVSWACDRIPFDYFEGLSDVPPLQEVCFTALPDFSDPEGPCVGAGGDGGPGLIQIHVEDLANLRFPDIELEFGGTYATGLDVTYAMAPPPEGWKRPGEVPDQMIPFFGRLSMAQSRWIPLGLARADGAGGLDQVVLSGLGGAIPHGTGETVDHEDPILGPEVLPDPELIVTLDASGLAPGDELYAENPALLRRASLRLEDSADADVFALYRVSSAEYDETLDTMTLHMDPTGPNPRDFPAGGDVVATLIPHTVRVITDGIFDAYPDEAEIRLVYDATVEDPATQGPSEALSYSAQNGDLTDDLSDLNAQHWDYFRFRAIFDLDTAQTGVDLTTPRPGLDSLRVRFEF